MNHNYGELARHLTPALRATFRLVAKAKTKSEIIPALETALITLKNARKQILSLKKSLSDDAEECILFETSLLHIGLAIRFLQLKVVTPQNKPDLLKYIYGAYKHMKKCRDKFYR